MVRRRFTVDYTPAGADLLLHRIGWSVQVPARLAADRELVSDVRAARWVLLSWAVLGATAYGAWRLWRSAIGAAAAAVAAVTTPAVVFWRQLRRWHRAGMGVPDRLRRSLDERQCAINRKKADLRERLALVDASARLSAFLSDWAASDAYEKYRGLLGQVRSELARLSDDLTRPDSSAGGAPRPLTKRHRCVSTPGMSHLHPLPPGTARSQSPCARSGIADLRGSDHDFSKVLL